MRYLAAQLSWPKVKSLAQAGAMALLPVGSTEAHGPHLPLNVDVVIAEEVCRRVAESLPFDCVVFPPVAYTLTDFAAPFAGTVSLPSGAAQALLAGVMRGVLAGGFAKVGVINHHLEPAHFALVHAAAKEVNAAGHGFVVVPDHRRRPTGPLLGNEFMHGGSHAGWYETSLMLAAAPQFVDETARLALADNPVDLPGVIKGGAKDFLEAGGPQAYFGSPATATAQAGESLFAILVQATHSALAM
jgi:creatinine amidohydrolase